MPSELEQQRSREDHALTALRASSCAVSSLFIDASSLTRARRISVRSSACQNRALPSVLHRRVQKTGLCFTQKRLCPCSSSCLCLYVFMFFFCYCYCHGHFYFYCFLSLISIVIVVDFVLFSCCRDPDTTDNRLPVRYVGSARCTFSSLRSFAP